MRALLLTAILALCAIPGAANAWWQKDWSYRKPITIDAAAAGITQPAGRVPLLIRLHSGDFSFADAQDDGKDIRFVAADDKTPLAFHLESFDPLLGVASAWVDVADFPVGTKKQIWLYYGNKKAPAAADSHATFDADYGAVYHFDDTAGSPPHDATANGSNALTAPGALSQASIVGKGAKFVGGAAVTVPASAALEIKAGAPFTFSAWVKPDAPQARAGLYARHDGGGSLIVGLDQGVPFVEVNGQRAAATTALTKGQWTHLAVVADGKSVTLYVGGKSATALTAALPALNTPAALGGDAAGASSGLANYVGEMDEVRLSRVERPADLIQADASAQGPDTKLVSIGEDEKPSGLDFGLFGVIVGSVDGLAWGVIAILGLMGALSWYVIWTKISLANRLDKANDLFLHQFREHGDKPLALADGGPDAPRITRSSIFRIYRAGAEEIRRRIAHGRVALDGEGAAVVRAMMDSALVRENQGLSASLVWLTIAISGGPFLGLLGTVMGVMITFASIALAGDVNINAIAPGISAALLATIAGLAVAIPALFGYNYILLRNKNISANMTVFTDEFVTRVSEAFRDGRDAH